MHADPSDLPFAPGSFTTVGCFATLHVLENPRSALAALWRQVAPAGRTLASMLITDRALGGAYLRVLSDRPVRPGRPARPGDHLRDARLGRAAGVRRRDFGPTALLHLWEVQRPGLFRIRQVSRALERWRHPSLHATERGRGHVRRRPGRTAIPGAGVCPRSGAVGGKLPVIAGNRCAFRPCYLGG